MKTLLQKIGIGLFALASLAIAYPAMATSSNANVNARLKFNLQTLSKFTLVSGELTAIGGTTLPTHLTVKLSDSKSKGEKDRTVTVAVEDKTIFSNQRFGKSSLAELMVGDRLQIFGRYDENGVLQALSVRNISIHVPSFAIVGTISALDPQAKTITLVHRSGFSHKWLPLTVYVTDQTKLVDQNRKPITFADLQLNQEARVNGVLNTRTYTFIATRVKATITPPAPPEPLPFSLKGSLTAMSTTSLPAKLTVKVTDILPPLEANTRAMVSEPINLVTFEVNADTKLMTQSGATLTLKDFTLSDILVVQGNMAADGTITAAIVRNDSVQLNATASGTVDSVDATAKTFVLVKADGSKLNVATTNATLFHMPDGTTTTDFASLKAGYSADIKGVMNTQTNWFTAAHVMVTRIPTPPPPEPLPFSLEGTLTMISTTSLPAMLTVRVTDILPPLEMRSRAMSMQPINLVTFKVDASTRLYSHSSGKISLANFAVGNKLVMQGNLNSDGTITATIIRNDSVDVTASALTGDIKSVNTTTQTFTFGKVGGITYAAYVGTDTKLSVPGVEAAAFADLKVGNAVSVNGLLNANTYAVWAASVTVTATTTATTTISRR